MNRVILVGRLGQDPEIRILPSGQKVGKFSIATNESWTDKSGEKKELTDWHNIAIFNESTVKFVEAYIKKGSRVFIEGALKTRKWADKTGTDRYSTEVVLSGFDARLISLGSKGNNNNNNNNNNRSEAEDLFAYHKEELERSKTSNIKELEKELERFKESNINNEIPF